MNDNILLTPIKIGGIELKNRAMYLAMAKYLATPDNYVTERQIEYYRSIAAG